MGCQKVVADKAALAKHIFLHKRNLIGLDGKGDSNTDDEITSSSDDGNQNENEGDSPFKKGQKMSICSDEEESISHSPIANWMETDKKQPPYIKCTSDCEYPLDDGAKAMIG